MLKSGQPTKLTLRVHRWFILEVTTVPRTMSVELQTLLVSVRLVFRIQQWESDSAETAPEVRRQKPMLTKKITKALTSAENIWINPEKYFVCWKKKFLAHYSPQNKQTKKPHYILSQEHHTMSHVWWSGPTFLLQDQEKHFTCSGRTDRASFSGHRHCT